MSAASGFVAAVPDGRYGRAGSARALVAVLAIAALMVQLAAAIDELNQRSIASATGIDRLRFDLTITETTGVAEVMGIEVGDRLISLNGVAMATSRDYRKTINQLALGSPAYLVVERAGREIAIAPVAVGRLPLKVALFVARHLIGLLCTAVAVWVGWVRPGLRSAQLFFLGALGLGVYLALAGTEHDVLIYVQSVALVLTPALAIHFFLVFPQERTAVAKRWWPLLYIPSLILLGLTLRAYWQSLEEGMGIYQAPDYWLIHSQVDFTFLAFSGVFGLLMVARAYATAESAVERRRLQWILWGLGLAILAAVIDMVFTLFGLHTMQADVILLLGALPLPLAFAFSILRYRLWDIDLVLKRSAVYGLLTPVLAAVYVLLIYVLSAAFGVTTAGMNPAAVLFISALVIGILVNPLRLRIQSIIDQTFFRSAVDHQRMLGAWSEELSTSLRFADLAALLLVEVPQVLQLERAWLLVLDEDERMLQPMACKDEVIDREVTMALSVAAQSTFVTELCRPGSVLLLYDRQDGAGQRDVMRRWDQLGVRVALPLVSGGSLVGIYLLGNKLSGDVYQRSDLELLRTLANQAAVAISNARLYEEVHAFSQEMETKVRERTQELRDFVSVVYHELSTPITSIRGYTEVLLDGAPGPLTNRQARYLDVVKRSIDRLMHLVGDLSDVSKIDDGRLAIHPEPMDLEVAVAETLGSLSGLIEEKGLQVSARLEKDATQVTGDPERVVQILTNLVENACRYTPAGGRVEVCASAVDGRAEVTVMDTGIGILSEEHDRIFERFYRSFDPLVQGQSGTGLGLAITRSLVELHGSKLWVSSSVGKGSTFGFSLHLVEAIEP